MIEQYKNMYVKREVFKEKIFKIIEERKILYTDHAIERMIERRIKQQEIRQALSDGSYKFHAKESDDGYIFIIKHLLNNELPTVIFSVNGFDEENPNEINIITTYRAVEDLDLNTLYDLFAKEIEYEMMEEDVEKVRVTRASENTLTLTDTQVKNLFDIILNEYYRPQIDMIGRGKIGTILPFQTYLEWELCSEYDSNYYYIEGEEYKHILKAIGYGKFRKEEETASTDMINISDTSETSLTPQRISERRIYGRLVNICLSSRIALEKELLIFEGIVDSFDYFTNRISKLFVYENALFYSVIKSNGAVTSKLIDGSSFNELMQFKVTFEEEYGKKLILSEECSAKLEEHIKSYITKYELFDSIISISYGQIGCEIYGVTKEEKLKVYAIIENEYLDILTQLDLHVYLNDYKDLEFVNNKELSLAVKTSNQVKKEEKVEIQKIDTTYVFKKGLPFSERMRYVLKMDDCLYNYTDIFWDNENDMLMYTKECINPLDPAFGKKKEMKIKDSKKFISKLEKRYTPLIEIFKKYEFSTEMSEKEVFDFSDGGNATGSLHVDSLNSLSQIIKEMENGTTILSIYYIKSFIIYRMLKDDESEVYKKIDINLNNKLKGYIKFKNISKYIKKYGPENNRKQSEKDLIDMYIGYFHSNYISRSTLMKFDKVVITDILRENGKWEEVAINISDIMGQKEKLNKNIYHSNLEEEENLVILKKFKEGKYGKEIAPSSKTLNELEYLISLEYMVPKNLIVIKVLTDKFALYYDYSDGKNILKVCNLILYKSLANILLNNVEPDYAKYGKKVDTNLNLYKELVDDIIDDDSYVSAIYLYDNKCYFNKKKIDSIWEEYTCTGKTVNKIIEYYGEK